MQLVTLQPSLTIERISTNVLHTDRSIHNDQNPDSKVHGANMGPIWGWQDPGGPHVGHMNFVIWENKALPL